MNGGRGLVSMVVQSYVEEVVHRRMMGLVGNYKGVHYIYHLGSTITIVSTCIVEWLSSMVRWKVLLPKGLIRSSWFRPSLIVLTLMYVPVIASIHFNNIRTKLKATGVRTHINK
ncbi:hypothetical protein AHAS_Ahas14G0136300 [Arachis hypogaea]